MNAEVKQMPEFHVAYVRATGAYGKETCEKAFGPLMQWCGPKGYCSTGQVLGLYWDDPRTTPPEKCRTDACVTVPKGTETESPVQIQTIEAGTYAVCSFEITCDQFPQAWQDAFEWLSQQKLECENKPCYELYKNNPEQDPEGKCLVDICIPLKQ